MMRDLVELQHLLVLLPLLFACPLAWSAGLVEYQFGKVVAEAEGKPPRPLSIQSEVEEGDTIKTAEGSSVRIRFEDRTQITLKANTTLVINSVRYQPDQPANDAFSVNLLKGGLRAITGLVAQRNRELVKVGAEVATIGIRGTHFGLQLCTEGNCNQLKTLNGNPMKDGLYADVASGKISLNNSAGSLDLAEGEFAHVAGEGVLPQKLDSVTGHKVTLPMCLCNGKTGKSKPQSGTRLAPADGSG